MTIWFRALVLKWFKMSSQLLSEAGFCSCVGVMSSSFVIKEMIN